MSRLLQARPTARGGTSCVKFAFAYMKVPRVPRIVRDNRRSSEDLGRAHPGDDCCTR